MTSEVDTSDMVSVHALPDARLTRPGEATTVQPKRISVAGVPIDVVDLERAVTLILERAGAHSQSASSLPPAFVVTPNAQHVCNLQGDAGFQDIYAQAWLSLADGVPLVWASRWLRRPLPGRVNGTDLFVRLCAGAARTGVRVFLLGGRPQAAERAASVLRERNPGLDVAWHCPPVGFEDQPEADGALDRAIREAKPRLVFVGLGSPKQERWIFRKAAQLEVPVAIGIGVSFELVAGMVPRAPVWMQRCGLEWGFRLICEPKRLWKRYLVGNPHFVALVLRHWLLGEVPLRCTAARSAEAAGAAAAPAAASAADAP